MPLAQHQHAESFCPMNPFLAPDCWGKVECIYKESLSPHYCLRITVFNWFPCKRVLCTVYTRSCNNFLVNFFGELFGELFWWTFYVFIELFLVYRVVLGVVYTYAFCDFSNSALRLAICFDKDSKKIAGQFARLIRLNLGLSTSSMILI